MTEYEQLKLAVARKLCKLDGWNWLELYKTHLRLDGEQIRCDYYRKADEILSIIAERCWLKDERFIEPQEGGLAWAMMLEGWRPVKPLKED